MAKKSFIEEADEIIGDTIYDLSEVVNEVLPAKSMIQTTLMLTYQQMTPEQQLDIVEKVGTDWFLKLSARVEKQLRNLTVSD